MTEETGGSQSVRHHYHTCFWPPGRSGVLLCGTALVVIGAAWLGSNLGLISEKWWDVVLPVLLIGWGAVTVIGSRSDS